MYKRYLYCLFCCTLLLTVLKLTGRARLIRTRLIRSSTLFEVFVKCFPIISCLKYTVNSYFHLFRRKSLPTKDLTVVPYVSNANQPVSILISLKAIFLHWFILKILMFCLWEPEIKERKMGPDFIIALKKINNHLESTSKNHGKRF